MTALAKVRGPIWAWRWAALILTGVAFGIGCGPANLAFLMMPFEPPDPPECDLAYKDKKKESKVVVLVSYAGAPDVTQELINIDQELSERFVVLLRRKLEEKKIKVKLVPPHLVKSFQNKEDWRTLSMADIGKNFQADKVVNLEINSISLFERHSPQLFKGNADILLTVNDVTKSTDDGGGEIWRKPYSKEYPRVKVITVDNPGSIARFRGLFINRICEELVDMFTPHETQIGSQPMDD